MKKLITLTLLVIATSSLSQAKEFAYKCASQVPGPQGKMVNLTITGILNTHENNYGALKMVSAIKINDKQPLELRDANSYLGGSNVIGLADQAGLTVIYLEFPDGNFKKLSHEKSGERFSYAAGISVNSIEGYRNNNNFQSDLAKNKIDCVGAVEEKSNDGFEDLWYSLGEDYSKFMTQTLWPQFNKKN